MHRILLSTEGLDVNDVAVDVCGQDAIHRLCSLLGPVDTQHLVGVKGSGRTGHWLRSGVVLISQMDGAELVELHVCFQEDAGPFSNTVAKTARFEGEVIVMGRSFRGGEGEGVVRSLPGVEGFGSLPSVRDGNLLVGFWLRKRMGRFGKRTGARCLVKLSAGWGGPKGFPRTSGSSPEAPG